MTDSCIIIIDPQKDFTSEDGAYAKRHPQIHGIRKAVNRIQQLIDQSRQHDIIVVYSNYEEKQFGEELSICIAGTEGHELGITIFNETVLLSKTQHSAFMDPVFSNYLDECGYKQLFLCGFLAEYCVKQTALDGLKKGYNISLIKDCIGTGDDVTARLEDTITELEKQNVSIIGSAYFI